MKIQLHLKLLILGVLISSGLFSQKFDYERDTKWNIGLNMGAVFQDSDIKLKTPGFGYGFTFGRSIYERPNGVFGLDLRFRYLRGTTYGVDPNRLTLDSNNAFYNKTEHNYLDSVGYTYLNNSTDLHDYSLEMVINFHRLRERTGILLHVFGGIGITDYQTKTNLLDDNGNLYNYSGLDTSGTLVSQAQKDLLDGDYESDANAHDSRQIKVMPSLGFGIGYQFGPSFSIGLEHRTTFTLNDVFEGHAAGGSQFINLQSGNDLYHYTGINFRWNILKGKYVEPTTVQNEPVTSYDPCDKPTVRIINPIVNEKFESKYISVSAKVSRVKSNNDVIVKVNSQSVQTQYSASTELVTANVTLVNGNNIIEVIASNSCGNTSKTVTVNYEEKSCLKPVIQASEPAQTVSKSNQTLSAKVTHLNGGTLSVLLNGNKIAHTYNASSQDLSAALNLVKGNNTIVIKGSNTCGDTTVSLNVTFNEVPCLAPLLTLVTPVNGAKLKNQLIILSAKVNNQTNRNLISVELNGTSLPFTFNPSSLLVSAPLNLLEGNNTIEVKVTNDCGVDTKIIAVLYEKAPCLAPSISIIPIQNGEVFQSNFTFKAQVEKIKSSSQVSLIHNGNSIASTFNHSNEVVIAQLLLSEGMNTISLIAKNECGSNEMSINVTYKKAPCLIPVISVVSPQNGQVFNQASVNFRSQVQQITSTSQVNVTLNGNSLASTLNSSTGEVTSQLTLTEGTNNIKLAAQNKCGADEKIISITYKKAPCLLPVISVVSPQNGQVFNQASVNFNAEVQNVNSGSQIQVKLNGANVASSYNAFNKSIIASLNLAKGNNIISITATNDCGSVTKEVMIGFSCKKPIVNIVSPANGLVVNNSSIQLSGSAINLVNQNQLSVKLNGAIVAFSFNNQTLAFSSVLNLVNGINIINVSVANECGTDTKEIRVTYNKPCLKPVISINSPVDNQNFTTANVSLTGTISNVSNQNQVTVEQDGAPVNFVLNGGNISANLVLVKGNNSITITATNSCGTVTVNIPVTYDAPCPKPTVSIVSLQNGQVFNVKTINFVANVSNLTNSSQAIISLNGTIVAGTYNGVNQTIACTLNLISGNNTIKVVAQNSCGTDKKTINVIYKCNTPKINFINENSLQGVTSAASTTITASVTNITSVNQIVVKLNGVVVPHNFDVNTGVLTVSVTLKEGKNTIDVIATNNCGGDTQNLVVNYAAPCVSPILSIYSPANGQAFTNASASLSGSVLNITTQSQLSLKLNGVAGTITYNISNKTYSANLTLQEGSNTIDVKASNECGSDTKTITVTYTKPCNKPDVRINSPSDGKVVKKAPIQLTGLVYNVTAKSQVQVLLNGVNQAFNFNASSKAFNASLTLKEGVNTIEVKATTSCGISLKVITVNYEACKVPAVSISSPVNNKSVTQTQVTYSAIALNITDKSDVTVEVNGAPVSFNFNVTTGIVSGAINANEGLNSIVIIVTKACGKDRAEVAFNKEKCDLPVITVGSQLNGTTVDNPNLNLDGYAQNIGYQAQMTIKVNGVGKTYNYNTKSGIYSLDLALVEGVNTIVLTATNNCGTTTETITLNYKPCYRPTLKLTNPQDRATIYIKTQALSATVKNVASSNQVTLLLNGKSFPFNLSGNTLTANLTGLVVGGNNIMIKVKTPCGSVGKEAFITVRELKPVISIATPKTDTVDVNTKLIKLAGTIQDIYKASDISITINGKLVKTISTKAINASNFQFGGDIALINGKNIILINATNKYSLSDVKTIVVNSNQPKIIQKGITITAPVKTITQPVKRSAPVIRK
jgi:hypothetical protein